MIELFTQPTTEGTIVLIAACAAVGFAVGKLKVRGIGLGVAAILFTALLASRLEVKTDAHVLHFARDFGLVLFVFSLGMQIGPGFFSSLRRAGLRMNVVAAGIVLLGTAMAWVGAKLGYLELAATVGVLGGSTTNTPSLAAGQATLLQMGVQEGAEASTAGYALTYAIGVMGTISVMLLGMRLLKHLPKRVQPDPVQGRGTIPLLRHANIEVTNQSVVGVPLRKLGLILGSGVVLTRHLSGGVTCVPSGETKLGLGDVVLAVGPSESVEQVTIMLGRESETNLLEETSEIVSRKFAVTHAEVVGRTLSDLHLNKRFGVSVSRVERAGVEMSAAPDMPLNFADIVTVVGPEDRVKQVQAMVGDSKRALGEPRMVPIFAGVALGVLVGSVPIAVPGLAAPVKLGLAAGPLLVGLALGRVGRIGPLICMMPGPAGAMMREVGIALFLASVGLISGGALWRGVGSGAALTWMCIGAMIVVIPLAIGGVVARYWLGLDRASIMGLMAGSMTDPPALALANEVCGNDAAAIAYTTVYPLTAVMRIVCMQVLVLSLLT